MSQKIAVKGALTMKGAYYLILGGLLGILFIVASISGCSDERTAKAATADTGTVRLLLANPPTNTLDRIPFTRIDLVLSSASQLPSAANGPALVTPLIDTPMSIDFSIANQEEPVVAYVGDIRTGVYSQISFVLDRAALQNVQLPISLLASPLKFPIIGNMQIVPGQVTDLLVNLFTHEARVVPAL